MFARLRFFESFHILFNESTRPMAMLRKRLEGLTRLLFYAACLFRSDNVWVSYPSLPGFSPKKRQTLRRHAHLHRHPQWVEVKDPDIENWVGLKDVSESIVEEGLYWFHCWSTVMVSHLRRLATSGALLISFGHRRPSGWSDSEELSGITISL